MKKFLISYFLFSFFFFTFFASGFVDSMDGFQYLALARRMYFDHTVEMPKENFDTGENVYLTIFRDKDGKIYSPTGLGYTLAFLPSVLVEDIFTRLAGVKPFSAFPLKSDWPVLLFASFTNAFFGALLVVTLYLFIKTYGVNHKNAALLSFLSITATNLFPYTKHTLAHMMFISFLVLCFYFIRRYSINKSPANLLWTGLFFGLTIISYNVTYKLTLLPLITYYLLSTKPQINALTLKKFLRDGIFVLIGIIPFYLLNYWFDFVRYGSSISPASGISASLPNFPVFTASIEGIWNSLFSPGRGFFIYSPILLTIALFWFKLKRSLLPEIISFGLLALLYIFFIGTLLGSSTSQFLVWHGEYSWGPRYLTPILPFAMILVAVIYTKLSKYQKLFVFLPLVAIGIWIQLIGILLPYQIKFGGLPPHLYINDQYLSVTEYANIIPRFSPIIKMSKTLIKRATNLKQAYEHGKYDVRLLDGYEYPFDLGYAKWRATLPLSYISFDNNKTTPIQQIDLQFRNHQIDKYSSHSATLSFYLNDTKLSDPVSIPINKEINSTLQIPDKLLKTNNNLLKVTTQYEGTTSARLKNQQVIFLQILRINGLPVNINTLDYPYVSPVSQKLFNSNYLYWGNKEQNPYDIWEVHSGVFEQTFDLWWLRPFHYWDFPKTFFLSLFAVNLSGLVYFGYRTFSKVKKL